MYQCEPLRVGASGYLARLAPGRVSRVAGAVGHLAGEGGVVYQQVRVRGRLDGPLARTRVAGVRDRSPGSRRTDDLVGLDDRPVGGLHRLAVVEPAELRTDGHAELLRRRSVEPTGSIVLLEHVPL